MFEFDEIIQLLEKINQSSLEEVEIEKGSIKIKVKKTSSSAPVQAVSQPVPAVIPAAVPVVETPTPVVETKPEPVKDYKVIKSPMVGTFYSKPSPDKPDFAKAGDKVNADTTVCIIEAMKLFNEIQADVSGEIVEVLVQNGQLVEYGQPLFYVK